MKKRIKNSEYVEKCLNPILHPLLTETLIHKPADPITFMINWLRNRYKRYEKTTDDESSKQEDKSTEDIPQIRVKEDPKEEMKVPAISVVGTSDSSSKGTEDESSPFVV